MSQQLLERESLASITTIQSPVRSEKVVSRPRAVGLGQVRSFGVVSAFIGVCFLMALTYAIGWARLTREDHTRQRLETQVERLRGETARLNFALDLARGPQRISETAEQAGMRLADAATELDQAVLPAENRPKTLVAKAGDERVQAGMLAGILGARP